MQTMKKALLLTKHLHEVINECLACKETKQKNNKPKRHGKYISELRPYNGSLLYFFGKQPASYLQHKLCRTQNPNIRPVHARYSTLSDKLESEIPGQKTIACCQCTTNTPEAPRQGQRTVNEFCLHRRCSQESRISQVQPLQSIIIMSTQTH